jgi:hypothetical protein
LIDGGTGRKAPRDLCCRRTKRNQLPLQTTVDSQGRSKPAADRRQ